LIVANSGTGHRRGPMLGGTVLNRRGEMGSPPSVRFLSPASSSARANWSRPPNGGSGNSARILPSSRLSQRGRLPSTVAARADIGAGSHSPSSSASASALASVFRSLTRPLWSVRWRASTSLVLRDAVCANAQRLSRAALPRSSHSPGDTPERRCRAPPAGLRATALVQSSRGPAARDRLAQAGGQW
jgi:hypothetical protein